MDQAPGQAGVSSGQVKEEEIMEHEAAEDDIAPGRVIVFESYSTDEED